MRLNPNDYLSIKDPDLTFLEVAHRTFQCSCARHFQKGDLYVLHNGAIYHLECAIRHGWIDCRPLRLCPLCHRFMWPGQEHDCPAPREGEARLTG